MTEAWSPETLKIAAEAARMAIEADRANRKLGRSDIGSGSEKVGKRLRQHREFANMTQRRLAELTGLHATTIGKIESGERGMSLKTFAVLGRYFLNIGQPEFLEDVVWEIE